MRVPPSDGAVVGVRGEDAVVDYCQVVDVHHVADKDMQFLDACL